MPLLLPLTAIRLLTADTLDLLSSVEHMANAGPGIYRITALAAAAADATITVKDGRSVVLNAVPIPVKAAAVTYPALDASADPFWLVQSSAKDRPTIDVADGTNAEITVKVERIR